MNATHESLVLIDREGTILLSNETGARRLGKAVREIIGTNIYDHFSPDVALSRKRYWEQALATGKPVSFRDTRAGRFFELYCYPVVTKEGVVSKAAIFAHDITERETIKCLFDTQRETFSSILETAPSGIFVNDCDGAFIVVNPEATRITGYTIKDIPSGRDWFAMAYPEKSYRKKVVKTWKKDVTARGIDRRFSVRCKDGVIRELEFRAAKLGDGQTVTMFSDVTERKRLEARLVHAEKMQALGALSRGIAHDFNNVLTIVQGCTGLMKRRMEESDPLFGYVERILSACQNATDLIHSLMAFSRQQPIKRVPLDINATIRKTEKLIGALLADGIALKTVYSPGEIIVKADATQIGRILFNLAANARDAMDKGGTLVIETVSVEFDRESVRLQGFREPGKYAVISVSDTGCGMDVETRKKIFEPFFSTKEPGKGTGLGLSTVYGIVKQHDGYILVDSAPGSGTTFRIYLPALREDQFPDNL